MASALSVERFPSSSAVIFMCNTQERSIGITIRKNLKTEAKKPATKGHIQPGVVAHGLNLSTEEAEARGSL